MKKVLSIILTLFVLALSFPVGAITTEDKIEGNYVEGDVLILTNDNGIAPTSSQDKELLDNAVLLYSNDEEVTKTGDDIVSTGKDLNTHAEGVYLIHSDTFSTSQLIKKFSEMDNVVVAEPNYIYSPDDKDNDTTTDYTKYQYSSLEGYTDVPSWNNKDIINCEDVVLAVMDSGVNYNHKDLKDVMWKEGENYPELVKLGGGKYGINTNFIIEGEDSTDPNDSQGHGTHCAGIIASKWNEFGTSGVCNSAKIMAIKATTKSGNYLEANFIYGFNYLVAAKKSGVNVKAVNCSWGGGYPRAIIKYLCDSIGKEGIITVFSAGNTNKNNDNTLNEMAYRSHSQNTITVGSSNQFNERAEYSCYGIRSTDVFAPGDNILSTYISKGSAYPDLVKSAVTDHISDEVFTYDVNTNGHVLQTTFSEGYDDDTCLVLSQKETTNDDDLIFKVTYDNKDNLVDLSKPIYIQFRFKQFDKLNFTSIYFKGQKDSGNDDGSSFIDINGWTSTYLKLTDNCIKKDENKIEVPLVLKTLDLIDQKMGPYDVYIDNVSFTNETSEYTYMDGTSMAAPYVTGEIGLACSKFKDDSADKIKARVIGAVTKTDEIKKGQLCRSGIVNIRKMLEEDYDPVVSNVTYTEDAITINGFFFDDLENVFLDETNANIIYNTSEKIVIEKPKGNKQSEALIIINTKDHEGRYMTKISDENDLPRINIKENESYKTLTELVDIRSVASQGYIYYLGKNWCSEQIIVSYCIQTGEFETILPATNVDVISNICVMNNNIFALTYGYDDSDEFKFFLLQLDLNDKNVYKYN